MSTSTRSRFVKASALVLAAAAWSAPAAFGQAPPATGGNTDDQRRQQFEQWRQQADTRMKELLKASDEEYAVLKPRIEKLQQLQRANDTRRVGFAMLMSGTSNWRTRGSNPGDNQRRPNDGGGDANRRPASPFGETPDTPVYQKSQELQAALEAKDAPADALKTKLAELRAARQQSRVEMAKMQEDLRQLCSIRQESVLVMMGILE
jgi:TolA-binding protein